MGKVLVSAAALALCASLAPAGAANAANDRPLSKVLTSDSNKFDSNSHDYDIVTEAVLAVLAAKPDSPVKVLTEGKTRLTAFVPNDLAFHRLVKALTGSNPKSEKAAFTTVAGLGIDTVETVLLYHVVPGATITAAQALKSDGASLTTAQGGKIKVDVVGSGSHRVIKLRDGATDLPNPKVVAPNINKGNKQIAHGIDRVLMPSNP